MHRIHRFSRRPLVAVALLALLAPLVLASTGTAGTAATARTASAVLDLSTQPGPAVPFRVQKFKETEPPPTPEACVAAGGDPRGDDCQDVLLTIAGTAPLQDVTVSVIESDGLYVDPMVTTIVDSGDDTSQTVGFAVRGRTSGLHTLTFEVTAPESEPRTITLPYVWRAGGTPLPGDDSLIGQSYGDNGIDTFQCGTEICSYRYSERLSFLTDNQVSRSLARRAQPYCGPSGTCPRYHYDSETGLIQIGRFIIGRVTETTAFFSGERYVPLAYPQRGELFDGAWSFTTTADEARGVGEEYLKLRPDGRFRLIYTFTAADSPDDADDESPGVRKRLGTYRIGRNGRLRLNDNKHKETLITTMAVVTSPSGKPLASSRGIWLDLEVQPSRPAKQFIDGNRMFPVT